MNRLKVDLAEQSRLIWFWQSSRSTLANRYFTLLLVTVKVLLGAGICLQETLDQVKEMNVAHFSKIPMLVGV